MKAALNAWIAEMRASGHWISACPSCGDFFAQLHKGRAGRRATICDWHRCILWHRFRNKYGRAPPAWLKLKWAEAYGDRRRADHLYDYQRRAA
jgi:hypothetical protein